jgi:hypothetical protein
VGAASSRDLLTIRSERKKWLDIVGGWKPLPHGYSPKNRLALLVVTWRTSSSCIPLS